jgi:hypothetical protein
MFTKDKALRVSIIYLWMIAILDLVRGFMHTFYINWANATFAQMEPNPDSLMMLGAFGISNILTGILYILILRKAKHLAPYVLTFIPFSYITGYIGLRLQNVQADSSFYGKYMMLVYLGLCILFAIYYWISEFKDKDRVNKH